MSEQVREMFKDISKDYDKLNSILSFGIHKFWRKRAVKESGAIDGSTVLDCAAGTGDLAFEFKRAVGSKGKVIATDYCQEMLDFIHPKSQKMQLEIDVQLADVMNLQFTDNSFDVASIAFGIRNVDSTSRALEEMARVVKPGGKVVVLEFGTPSKFVQPFYKFYSKAIIPTIGRLISKNISAYSYLPDTIAKYPYGKQFIDIMNNTGYFSDTQYKKLSFGITYLYIGTVKG
jgi:demethylmenaquinone methyltransferase / 2-methoxy-6-polyprenyl-1,4-benzoquinol methylase